MVKLRPLINYVIGFTLIVIFITGVRLSLDTADKYGWNHNRTIIVGTDILTEEVSVRGQIYSEIFLLMIGISLIITGVEISGSSQHPSHTSITTGIGFTGVESTYWDVYYDPQSRIIGVTLNDMGITLPLAMIEKWIEKPPRVEDRAEET